MKLKPCPFCGAETSYNEFGNACIEHKEGCYFSIIYSTLDVKIHDTVKWNNRVKINHTTKEMER